MWKNNNWLLSGVDIRTKLRFGNIMYGCLKQVGFLINNFKDKFTFKSMICLKRYFFFSKTMKIK